MVQVVTFNYSIHASIEVHDSINITVFYFMNLKHLLNRHPLERSQYNESEYTVVVGCIAFSSELNL